MALRSNSRHPSPNAPPIIAVSRAQLLAQADADITQLTRSSSSGTTDGSPSLSSRSLSIASASSAASLSSYPSDASTATITMAEHERVLAVLQDERDKLAVRTHDLFDIVSVGNIAPPPLLYTRIDRFVRLVRSIAPYAHSSRHSQATCADQYIS
jgi:hypothetical protein